MDTPLPTLTPRPRFAACPPPQPGMLVTVLPPPTMLGAPVLNSLVLATAGDAIFIAVPGGIMPLSRASWPPDDVVAVHSALGDMLWDRRVVAVETAPLVTSRRRTDAEIRAEQEANRPPEDALHRCPPHQYPVERRPGWLCEEDRWFGEWVYTREADGAEVRVACGGTWDDADIDLDEFERLNPVRR